MSMRAEGAGSQGNCGRVNGRLKMEDGKRREREEVRGERMRRMEV
jgi:hypothetical protein